MNWLALAAIMVVVGYICGVVGWLKGVTDFYEPQPPKPVIVPTTIRDMEEYVDFCESVWVTPYDYHGIAATIGNGLDRATQVMTLGLAGEVGEVMEWIKKFVRDGSDDKELLLKEFGDVQFYLYMLARRFGFSVNDVVAANVEKLKGRVERGTQRGSGDSR